MTAGSKWNAELYDDKHSFVWKMAAGLLDLLDAKPGERILDLGCGTGPMAGEIAKKGATVVGVDRSPEMVEHARRNYPELQFEVMDAREIVFAEPFDAVFSNATLHWIKEPERAVAGIAKALKPGGRFVAEFGGKRNVQELMLAAARAWKKLGLPGAPEPWYYPGIAEYSGILEQYGLEVTYANLFERPTPLEDGENGMRNWLKMFGSAFVGELPEERKEAALRAIEEECGGALLRNGQWVMDYRRLRVVGRKAVESSE